MGKGRCSNGMRWEREGRGGDHSILFFSFGSITAWEMNLGEWKGKFRKHWDGVGAFTFGERVSLDISCMGALSRRFG